MQYAPLLSLCSLCLCYLSRLSLYALALCCSIISLYAISLRSLSMLSLSALALCSLYIYALYLDYESTLGYVHTFHNDVISLRSLSMISLLYTIGVPSPHRYTTLCNHLIAVLSLYHRCHHSAPSLYHHSTLTAPSLHQHYHHQYSIFRGTITAPSLRTITVPSRHIHCTITAPSRHHHTTLNGSFDPPQP